MLKTVWETCLRHMRMYSLPKISLLTICHYCSDLGKSIKPRTFQHVNVCLQVKELWLIKYKDISIISNANTELILYLFSTNKPLQCHLNKKDIFHIPSPIKKQKKNSLNNQFFYFNTFKPCVCVSMQDRTWQISRSILSLFYLTCPNIRHKTGREEEMKETDWWTVIVRIQNSSWNKLLSTVSYWKL